MLAFASIYINIQNGEISTDHLSGLYNRKSGDDFIGRMGGDEFIIVGERKDTNEIIQLKYEIYSRSLAFNERKEASKIITVNT